MGKHTFSNLEDCVIEICEEDPELAESEITFFLHCFFSHLPEKKAREMMLIIKQAAERCLYFGAE